MNFQGNRLTIVDIIGKQVLFSYTLFIREIQLACFFFSSGICFFTVQYLRNVKALYNIVMARILDDVLIR